MHELQPRGLLKEIMEADDATSTRLCCGTPASWTGEVMEEKKTRGRPPGAEGVEECE